MHAILGISATIMGCPGVTKFYGTDLLPSPHTLGSDDPWDPTRILAPLRVQESEI